MTTNPQVFTELEQLYRAQDLETQQAAATAEMPAPTLWVRFEGFGRGEIPLDLGFSLLPLPGELAAGGVQILQTLCEFVTDVAPERVAPLLDAVGRINIHLPLGAFGVLARPGVVYLKHNCLIDLARPAAETARAVDQQAGVLLHVLSLFADALRDVAAGTTPPQALAQTTMAALFAS